MTRLDSALETSVVGSFTSIGHKLRSRSWEPIAEDVFSDRIVLITGATSGIGRKVALEAAMRGAGIRFVARSLEKAETLLQDLNTIAGHTDHRFYLADLSAMAEVREASRRILDGEPSIHVLINNAVVLPATRTETSEGIELSHATNVLAPFLLTNQLKQRLVESAPARIINVVSGGMYTQGLALDDLNYTTGEYRGSVAYARAKRRLMVLTKTWADQLAGTGVTVNATHPGWVDTPGVRDSLPMFHRITRPLLRTQDQGADTIVWLASSARGGLETGHLWHDRAIRSEHRLRSTIETSADRNRLWKQLTAQTK